MKKKSLIILSSLILLTACSNGNKNTTDKNFSSKDKIAKTSKSSSSVEKSSSSSSESSPSTSKSSSQTSTTESTSQTGTTPSSNTQVDDVTKSPYEETARATSVGEEYITFLYPSAMKPEDIGTKYRDGFYFAPANGVYIIGQYTNGQMVDSVETTQNNSGPFLLWLRQVAPSGTTSNGLESNYFYWHENVRYGHE